jgi:SHS2 domain-containing protein
MVRVVAHETRAVNLEPADDDEMLIALLDEVIYLVDALAVVPVMVQLEARADGGLTGTFQTVPATAVAVIGAVPKGISRSELFIGSRRGRWRCSVEVDV